MGIAKAAIDGVWGKIMEIDPSMDFETPTGRKTFRVTRTDHDRLMITTSGDNPVQIRKEAFESAIAYLLSHAHTDEASRCEIRSNQEYQEAGPLCRSTREPNGTMTITYILPILKFVGLVGIASAIPTSTWIIA